MLRPLILKADTDIKSLASDVLRARLSDAQTNAAVDKLAEANPHVDPDKIAAGTVVLVPDTPGFKASAADSVQSGPFNDFGTMVSDALGAAAEKMKAGNAARATDRSDLAAAVKSAVFKRLTANDPDTQRQADEAVKAASADADADKQAEEMLATVSKAALAVLGELGKAVK